MLHINDIQFFDLDILDLLTSLDTGKTCGIDSLSPKLQVSKICAASNNLPFISYKYIFQYYLVYTLCNSCVQNWWQKFSVQLYRPISLLCILSKVLERIVYNNLIDYVRKDPPNISMVSYQADRHSNNCLHLQIKSLSWNVKLILCTWTLRKLLILCPQSSA